MTTILRVLAGTAVYVLIVILAAPFPAAAGLMLTFPTLNGLAFVFAGRDRVAGMARSMLWMPVLNGVLCAGYALAFPLLTRALPPAGVAWGLTALVTSLFFLVAFQPGVLVGVAPQRQRAFAITATCAGAALVLIAYAMAGSPAAPIAAGAALSWSAAGDAIARNAVKIVLFALCLAAFLLATRVLPLSDGVRGVLAGLPFVPFAGLLSVAGDATIDLESRLAILRQMAVSIWLGPAIAIWFIYGFSRSLLARPPGRPGPALLAAWALCGLAVAMVTSVLS